MYRGLYSEKKAENRISLMRHNELDEPRYLNQGKPNRKGNKGRIRLERADRRVALEPINLLRPIELNPTKRFELRVDDQVSFKESNPRIPHGEWTSKL